MPATDLISQVSLSLLAENRADTKEQSALRSALSSASCQRSGRSPALPYPLHEQFQSTMLSHQPFHWGHLYFVKKGTFLLWLDTRGHFYFGTALTRMGIIKAQQVKSQFRLCIEQAPSLGQVLIAILQAEPDDRIVQDSHYVTSISDGQPSGIFLEGYISAVM
jgi:hypothetical protein